MLNSIRKFSGTIFAKILLVIVTIPFVLWGMGGVFSSGNTNSLGKINNFNISTQDFMDHLRSSRIEEKLIKENLNNNILEELLTQMISKKLIDLEIKDFNIIVSEKALVNKLKKNKEFLDEKKNFSRIEYEKFLLSNNISANRYESILKESELRENLFKYISGGIKSPYFLTNNIYKNENKNITIQFINLEKLYKSRDKFTNEEIKKFINENKDTLKKDYVDFSYAKITPKNLIGSEEYNKEFFSKIDEIENKISNQEKFNQIIIDYKLDKVTRKDFISSENNDVVDNEIYKARNEGSLFLDDKEEYFLLVEIESVKSRLPSFDDSDFLNKVRTNLYNKNKYEFNKALIEKINSKNFNDNDFKKMGNDTNNTIKDLKLKSINDRNKFTSESLEIIYSLPKNNYSIIADHKNNIYLAKIVDIKIKNITENDKDFNEYNSLSIGKTKNDIYTTYDNFLNSKYNIKINEKTLERVKNYFR